MVDGCRGLPVRRHCQPFLLRVEIRALRVMLNSSGVGLLARQDKAGEDLFSAGRPAPQLALVVGFPDLPGLPARLASAGSVQRRVCPLLAREL